MFLMRLISYSTSNTKIKNMNNLSVESWGNEFLYSSKWKLENSEKQQQNVVLDLDKKSRIRAKF